MLFLTGSLNLLDISVEQLLKVVSASYRAGNFIFEGWDSLSIPMQHIFPSLISRGTLPSKEETALIIEIYDCG